ncbi:hypothetical protein FIBSPDRAFT_931180 [Athelia psychrophila]|uniref:Uncharacterized protein n=1 Tax=Athelia psychrophila TaxID=1759441 RepID=A0A166KYS5_9AGAM|nr:hypothetical protein FIBSPDRAFT_931178 [Fibularhizoctonia sp. CBS 109695]KZP22398.1 hypothetical protein FIBSPDRAFT_931180 [Fibularhizoctonia sp. CBS 109695]
MSFELLHATNLFLTFVFGAVGGSLGVSALVKAESAWNKFTAGLPNGTFVLVNATDLLTPGAITTIICFLICINALVFLLFIVIPPAKRVQMSARTLLFQATTLLVFGLGLFGTLVPYTLFVARRAPGVSAFIGVVQIPDAILKDIEKATAWSGDYKDVPYLRILAILPWVTFAFTMVTTAISFIGLRRYHAKQAAAAAAAQTSGKEMTGPQLEGEEVAMTEVDAA